MGMALSLLLIDLLKITKLSNELLLTQFYSFSLIKTFSFPLSRMWLENDMVAFVMWL